MTTNSNSIRPRLWRQGDILIQECAALPEGCKKVNGRVIARGEATGHAHKLAAPRGARLYSPLPGARGVDKPGQLYLQVTADTCDIIHEEHAPITLGSGVYELWRQREYDLARRAFRAAAD